MEYRTTAEVLKTILSLWASVLVLNSEGCDKVQPLGVATYKNIPNNQMSASSSKGKSANHLTPEYGRINSQRAWCPKTAHGFDWLKVDMGKPYFLCGIATQGKAYEKYEWTSRYWIAISRDDITWMQYEEDNKVKIFQGNRDNSSIVRNNFTSRVWAQYVRFYPMKYHGWPCLRVELYVQIIEPVILQHPKNSTIVAGDNLLLNCTAKGSPMPKITWKLNGNDIIFGRQLANGSLWVEKVENNKNFEGKYGCIATNTGGSARSKLVDVVIHEKPRILKCSQPHKSFVSQTTAVLSCCSIGDPAPKITWTKDGSTKTLRATIHDDGHVLAIPNVSKRDQGVYRCLAINHLGRAQAAINVVVERPKAQDSAITMNTLLTRKAIQTALMQTVNIGCYGNSLLPLTYRWFKDKLPIAGNHSNNAFKVYGNILTVTPNDVKDYGTYVCHVSNGVNSTEFEIELQQSVQKSGPDHAQVGSNPNTSKGAPMGIFVTFVVILILSILVNILLFRQFYMKKRVKKSLQKSALAMSGISNDESSLIQQKAEIDWDHTGHSVPQSNQFSNHDDRSDFDYQVL